MQKTKHIFMAVLGTSPAIITEALYYYTNPYYKKKINFDEIVIFTTSKGKDVVCNTLFKKNIIHKMEEDLELKKGYFNFSEKNIIVYKNERGKELKDIRNEEESLIAVNTMFDVMKKYTKINESKIIATIAGGRKSMASMMTTSFQMLSRQQDELIHIMASDENMFNHDWFYPSNPKSKNEKLDISLLPILKIGRFLPLSFEKSSYLDTLKKMQDYITDNTPISELIIEKGIFRSGKEEFSLPAVRASYLRYLIEKRANAKCDNKCEGCKKCFASMDELEEELGGKILEQHIQISGKWNGNVQEVIQNRKNGVRDILQNKTNIRSDLSRIRTQLQKELISLSFKNTVNLKDFRIEGIKFYGVTMPKNIIRFI